MKGSCVHIAQFIWNAVLLNLAYDEVLKNYLWMNLPRYLKERNKVQANTYQNIEAKKNKHKILFCFFCAEPIKFDWYLQQRKSTSSLQRISKSISKKTDFVMLLNWSYWKLYFTVTEMMKFSKLNDMIAKSLNKP